MKEYKLSQVAKMLNVHRDTILYWEENKMIPKPRRNPKNNYRTYNEKEIKLISDIRGVKIS
ncbi:MerR family transcriptional regulator [Virgibacillus salexigens]|uniref:Zinc-responsive transcriptional regulator n=1 Tax=Virgibacillus massiliensis TaxID=1462526 RepID=A0A024QI44_9BACI|nr:MerR family transcriptional regulator [Virgibacillus massiliensis]CDQ41902.1 zinc-responsive transcriptional regulator [Virgibacillus massiliensis]